jgi:hypothetical protein
MALRDRLWPRTTLSCLHMVRIANEPMKHLRQAISAHHSGGKLVPIILPAMLFFFDHVPNILSMAKKYTPTQVTSPWFTSTVIALELISARRSDAANAWPKGLSKPRRNATVGEKQRK